MNPPQVYMCIKKKKRTAVVKERLPKSPTIQSNCLET